MQARTNRAPTASLFLVPLPHWWKNRASCGLFGLSFSKPNARESTRASRLHAVHRIHPGNGTTGTPVRAAGLSG